MAVTVTSAGDEEQEATLGGEVERASFAGLLLLGRNRTNPAAGLQDTESNALADPAAAEKLRVRGLIVQAPFGLVNAGAKATDA